MLNAVPDSYEWFTHGKMPFENLFFEFIEPAALRIPFGIGDSNIRGIWFHKTSVGSLASLISVAGMSFVKTFFPYQAEVYFEDNSGKLREFAIQFNPLNLTLFRGSSESESLRFYADLVLKRVFYSTAEEIISASRLYQRIKRMVNLGYHHREHLDRFTDNEFFTLITNLCTNIINYVNAQNTTVVRRQREIDIMLRENGKKKKKVTRSVP